MKLKQGKLYLIRQKTSALVYEVAQRKKEPNFRAMTMLDPNSVVMFLDGISNAYMWGLDVLYKNMLLRIDISTTRELEDYFEEC